jgi:hypothetical protein
VEGICARRRRVGGTGFREQTDATAPSSPGRAGRYCFGRVDLLGLHSPSNLRPLGQGVLQSTSKAHFHCAFAFGLLAAQACMQWKPVSLSATDSVSVSADHARVRLKGGGEVILNDVLITKDSVVGIASSSRTERMAFSLGDVRMIDFGKIDTHTPVRILEAAAVLAALFVLYVGWGFAHDES